MCVTCILYTISFFATQINFSTLPASFSFSHFALLCSSLFFSYDDVWQRAILLLQRDFIVCLKSRQQSFISHCSKMVSEAAPKIFILLSFLPQRNTCSCVNEDLKSCCSVWIFHLHVTVQRSPSPWQRALSPTEVFLFVSIGETNKVTLHRLQ